MIGVLSDTLDPFYNLALEEYLFRKIEDKDVFLLWRNRPSVVVGCYQNISQEVNLLQLKQKGVPVVRRMSGGGTVYHDLGNINYSLMRDREKCLDYGRFLSVILSALQSLGIQAEQDKVSDLCIRKKKISGSAQKVSGNRVLHHGTLLYDAELSLLSEICTAHKSKDISSKASVSAISEVTKIKKEWEKTMEKPPSTEEFMELLFRQLLGRDGEHLVLEEEEHKEIEELAEEKYRSWEWTLGKSPAFHFHRETQYKDYPLIIDYHVQKGMIENFAMHSPLLDEKKTRDLFQGKRYKLSLFEENVEKVLGQQSTREKEALLSLLL